MGRFRLPYISPLAAGKVLAVLYFFIGVLFFLPFILLSSMAAPEGSGPFAASMGIGMMTLMLIFYPVGGFIGGVIGAFFYNLAAKVTGGIEFELENAE